MREIEKYFSGNIKQLSDSRWVAKCPIHDDSDYAMYITHKEGRTLIYCHGCGAKGKDLCEPFGISQSTLFDDDRTFVPRIRTSQHRLINHSLDKRM